MKPEPREARQYDLVLFGATGFTGKLVAEYLATARPKGLAWALAGRSRDKLERVRAELAAVDASLASMPIVVADSADESALEAIARSTRVVVTTVGPYAKYGFPLASACAAHGTDYCDLTGEVQYIRELIDRVHTVAEASGARIVPTCGFDSLPSDLGVHLLHEHFAARGLRLGEAKLYVEALKGGASGGTFASMMDMIEQAKQNPSLRSLLGDPYALYPDRKKDRGSDGRDQMGVAWDEDVRRWTGPFVMAAINARVVRRTNALTDFSYGRDFRYGEVMSFKKGPEGFVKATALTVGLGAFMAIASVDVSRSLLITRLPAPGEGPSKAERDGGFFRIRVVGRSASGASGAGERAVVLIEGKRDPGYGQTARMLGEAALCLAKDDLPRRGGVLTPASCMGTKLVDRLRASDMVWRVEASDSN